MSTAFYIRGGRLVDPGAGRDEAADLFIQNGKIAPLPGSIPDGATVIDAGGLVVAPGFLDIHVHLREPGNDAAETIETGSQAAARGGFTTIVAMPNTKPPLSTAERVLQVTQRGDEVGAVRVRSTGCITKDRAGQSVADLEGMAKIGAVAFTDDGYTVMSDDVMRAAMLRARDLDIPIMDHAQDTNMERQGVMHEGTYSEKLGLPGIPSEAEAKIIRRDIELAEETGCRLHIQHVTSRQGVELIRGGRDRGVKVSGEATPHHLALTDADIDPENASYKMNPPLRSRSDQEALLEGVVDGTLEMLATDHAPHTEESKSLGFLEAPFGLVGLETAVGVTYTTLVRTGMLDFRSWIERWTTGPAQVLSLPIPSLEEGQPADVVLLDLESEWEVKATAFVSRSRNTPFEGRKLIGQAIVTLHDGKITWNARETA